ncbi:hypothetical protein H0B56_00140 [Haloechinothrix sp. YIM 98757]|uniref:Excreted virulence factor EspC, type VII ESX diderm n=1 Tax=Haloechinothrix aidingensis TaxID=2752311 RepID=A0A838A6V4_9PSEU|nr:hypothetical protein [Haloechinothrix aidingensis]MBA0123949.1 hypothetical protein [Haloechinothrix aidingensis]
MSGYEAETESIRASAEAAHAAADRVADEDAADTVAELGSAMPGSASAEAASSLAEQWRTEFSAWVGHMRTYGDNLRDSAETYESSEEAAARAFGDVPLGDARPI